jgi:hypothetical protein
MSSPMTTIVRGRLYFAGSKRFTHPGIHLWTGKRHIRILPLPKWAFRR